MTDADSMAGEHEGAREPAPLWRQIGLAVLVAYLVATAVAAALLAFRIQALSADSAGVSLRHDVALLGPTVRRALIEANVPRLRTVTSAAADIGDVRVTVVLPDGEVVAESERALPLPNHADRPEIRAALETGTGTATRFSTTVGARLLYFARRIDDESGTPLGVLRASTPLEAFAQSARKLWGVVILALLVGLPVAALVGWFAARRIARPIESITAAAARMAAGDFEALADRRQDDVTGRLTQALRAMAREIRTTLETSESDRAELGAILGSMVEGVLAVDRGGRVLRANHGVARCLELPATPGPGMLLSDVAPLPALTSHARRALDGEDVADTDVTVPGPRERVLSVSAAPIRGPSGDVNGGVVVLRDVTALRRLERARLDFVANVSHELRTPVAAILGALETVQSLQPGEDDAARERLLRNAVRNGKRLANLVTDLLALSAIESELEQMERSPVPLLRALRAVVANSQPLAARGEIELVGPSTEDPDLLVVAHEVRLEIVWTNLIENALKYTPAGGRVTVTVDRNTSADEVCVSVADTGAGIPEAALPRIFERFYRVDTARSRERGGTGLGLAIVKHVVRAHRGRVEVESTLGEGSTFRVWLPRS